MSDERWIIVPSWNRYQHYKDRAPKWIKDYPEQLDLDSYQQLTFAERGLLQDLRRLYSRRRGQVRGDTTSLQRALGQRVIEKHLEALIHAGFVHFSASKPLALAHAGARSQKVLASQEPKSACASEGESARARALQEKTPKPRPNAAAYEHYDPVEPPVDPDAAEKLHAIAAEIGRRS